MDTRLTVADCRTALYEEVDATDANTALFIPRINEVCERFISSGKWKGTVSKVTLPVSTGFVTLPRWYQSVLTMSYQKSPFPIFTPFYEFSDNGPGTISDTYQFPGVLIDLGDGFCTQADIITAGTLRVTVGGAGDASKVIRIYGEDIDGRVMYDSGNQGVPVSTANPIANTLRTFSKVTGLQAPSNMTLPWTLHVVNGATATLLGTYYPGETRPTYHRYQTGVTSDPIQTLCCRRFIPVVAETDWVIPGNLSALRFGLKALAFERAGQLDMASSSFATALTFLNQEAKASRGGAAGVPNLRFFGVRGRSIPVTF